MYGPRSYIHQGVWYHLSLCDNSSGPMDVTQQTVGYDASLQNSWTVSLVPSLYVALHEYNACAR